MRRNEFIRKVKESWREYEASLSGLTEAQILQPATCGEWSIREVIAHVMWYEREMVAVIRQRELVGSALWSLPLEERNTAVSAEMNGVSWQALSTEFREVHQGLLEQLENLSDEDLNQADRFRAMPPDWIPWEVIASNTFEHYPEHSRAIQRAFPRQSNQDHP
jgi:uncharacterized protein (TIGR03083 family)